MKTVNKFQRMANARDEETKQMSDALIFKTMVETILGKEELDQTMKIDFLRHSFEDQEQVIEILERLILNKELEEREGRRIISALSSRP